MSGTMPPAAAWITSCQVESGAFRVPNFPPIEGHDGFIQRAAGVDNTGINRQHELRVGQAAATSINLLGSRAAAPGSF